MQQSNLLLQCTGNDTGVGLIPVVLTFFNYFGRYNGRDTVMQILEKHQELIATAQVSMKRLHHIIYDFKKLLFYDLEEPGIFANTL